MIIDSSYKLAPFTPDTNTDKDERLLVGAESAQWFKDHKVKAVGFGDGVSIENCNEDVKPFHDILMAENIVFFGSIKESGAVKEGCILHELFSTSDQGTGFQPCTCICN